MQIIKDFCLYVIIFCIVLNPYTVVGRPGIFISVVLCIYVLNYKNYKIELKENAILFLLVLFVGLWGSLVSVFNGIGQFNHLFSAISLIVVCLSAQGIYFFCFKNNIDFDKFIFILLSVVLSNYLLILFEANFPSLRTFTEGFLIPAGNIDWKEGFRYRGFSASGGAGLSILLPVTSAITFYLYMEKKIGVGGAIFSLLVSVLATLLIGRTGLFLFPIVLFFYFVKIFLIFTKNQRFFLKNISFIFLSIFVFMLSYNYIIVYLQENFGIGFVNYSFGFLFQGIDGIESEGTVGIIAEFLTVLPVGLPEIITGYGFYGGSEFNPWSDSGYSRMFLSVGFPLGILFYFCVFRLFFKNITSNKFLFFSIGAVLLIAEAKEPLLFSGNASRAFILIVVFFRMQCVQKFQEKRRVYLRRDLVNGSFKLTY